MIFLETDKLKPQEARPCPQSLTINFYRAKNSDISDIPDKLLKHVETSIQDMFVTRVCLLKVDVFVIYLQLAD